MMAPGHWRGMDLLSPVWNFLDLTPEGRGDWMPKRFPKSSVKEPRGHWSMDIIRCRLLRLTVRWNSLFRRQKLPESAM